ncbi:hypothetical protein B0H14DRAFT_3560915, partial [Mycena olivaceomarginata]
GRHQKGAKPQSKTTLQYSQQPNRYSTSPAPSPPRKCCTPSGTPLPPPSPFLPFPPLLPLLPLPQLPFPLLRLLGTPSPSPSPPHLPLPLPLRLLLAEPSPTRTHPAPRSRLGRPRLTPSPTPSPRWRSHYYCPQGPNRRLCLCLPTTVSRTKRRPPPPAGPI